MPGASAPAASSNALRGGLYRQVSAAPDGSTHPDPTDHDGEPVHKVCAEDWNDRNPGAPRHQHDGRDLGTRRFHSDPPRKTRKDGAR